MRVGLVISSAGKIKMNISQIFFGISVHDSDANCLYGTSFTMLCNGKPRWVAPGHYARRVGYLQCGKDKNEHFANIFRRKCL